MRAKRRRALTLIELLVAIGVIGILLALSAPMLHDARRAAGQAVSLANLAGIGRTFEAYLGANDGLHPVALPGEQHAVTLDGNMTFSYGDRWAMAWHWAAVIRDFAPWEDHIQTWASPGSDAARRAFEEGAHFIPDYRYANSFVASPSLWTPQGAADAAENPSRYLQRVRAASVVYPSGKVMHYDHVMTYHRRKQPRLSDHMPDDPTPMLFADGHAATHLPRDATDPIENVLNGNRWKNSRLHNTPEGVFGRDY